MSLRILFLIHTVVIIAQAKDGDDESIIIDFSKVAINGRILYGSSKFI